MSFGQVFQEIDQQEWVEIPEGWLQGRTIFGGLTTAMMLHKATQMIHDPQKRLLSTSVVFVGPVQEKPVKVKVEILRQGKSVTNIEARIWQDDAVQGILLASFGSDRESVVNMDQTRTAPQYDSPESLVKLPYHPLMPQCYQNYDLIWAEGKYPCTAAEKPDFGGWFRYAESKFEAGPLSMPEFIAMLDIWPAGIFPILKKPAPGSSISWYVTLLEPIHADRRDWFKYKVFTDHSAHGYSTEYAHIWDHNDRLVAICRQTVAIFA